MKEYLFKLFWRIIFIPGLLLTLLIIGTPTIILAIPVWLFTGKSTLSLGENLMDKIGEFLFNKI